MKKRSLQLDKEVLTKVDPAGAPYAGTTNPCWVTIGYIFGKVMDALIECIASDSCGEGGGGDASTPAAGCPTGSCACQTNQPGGPQC